MRFEELRTLSEEIPVFSLPDIRHQDPGFHLPRLSEWQKQKKIIKLRQGIYAPAHFFQTDQHLYFAANRIYSPSYVSFETALSLYQVIPEAVYSTASATPKKTQTFITPVGSFRYHHLKPTLMFGYTLIPFGKWRYKIATLEKAVLDFLYIHTNINTPDDFIGLRWNAQILTNMDWASMDSYMRIFDNKRLSKRIQSLKRVIQTCSH
jgi:predicted transcriptional regulator of viral defense system